jgi:flagellar FliL protein
MVDEPQESTEGKSKKGKLWILIALLSLVVAGDLALRALGYFKEKRSPETGIATESEVAKGSVPSSQSRSEVKSTLPLEPFLVNLADKDEIRFVKATFHLGLEEKSGEGAKDPVSMAAMRDTIISILSSKTSDQILTIEGKDKLREEIRKRLNDIAPKMRIQEIFIVDFVVQL